MQPVAASRKSSPQVFSAFNIAVMNDYIFLTEAAMPQKGADACGRIDRSRILQTFSVN